MEAYKKQKPTETNYSRVLLGYLNHGRTFARHIHHRSSLGGVLKFEKTDLHSLSSL